MPFPSDLTTLSREDLIVLVLQLRQQLAEREREIKRLTKFVAKEKLTLAPSEQDRDAAVIPKPGTQEDLLSRLEREYPEG